MISNNLLSINITNIKVDYDMADAKVTAGTNRKAEVSRSYTPSKLDVNVKNAFVHIDTTAARSSLNQDTMETFAKKNAQKGYEAVMKATDEYVAIGNQIGKLHEGATIAGVYKNKFINDELQCQTSVRFVPSSPANITVDPVQVDVVNTPGEMNADWRAHQFELGFTPARFDQMVTQQPNVDIQYMGAPIYV